MHPRFDTSSFGKPEQEAAPADSFRERLDALHQWPCMFVFKFIMRPAHVFDFQGLFPGEHWTTRESSGGKYICITMEKRVADSDEVIAVYARARRIPGVLML